jgi:hypothetical protein
LKEVPFKGKWRKDEKNQRDIANSCSVANCQLLKNPNVAIVENLFWNASLMGT